MINLPEITVHRYLSDYKKVTKIQCLGFHLLFIGYMMYMKIKITSVLKSTYLTND